MEIILMIAGAIIGIILIFLAIIGIFSASLFVDFLSNVLGIDNNKKKKGE